MIVNKWIVLFYWWYRSFNLLLNVHFKEKVPLLALFYVNKWALKLLCNLGQWENHIGREYCRQWWTKGCLHGLHEVEGSGGKHLTTPTWDPLLSRTTVLYRIWTGERKHDSSIILCRVYFHWAYEHNIVWVGSDLHACTVLYYIPVNVLICDMKWFSTSSY